MTGRFFEKVNKDKQKTGPLFPCFQPSGAVLMKVRFLHLSLRFLSLEKSLIAESTFYKKHPLYGKYMKRAKTYAVHSQSLAASIGDKIEIKQTRPISKTKNWVIVNNLGKVK